MLFKDISDQRWPLALCCLLDKILWRWHSWWRVQAWHQTWRSCRAWRGGWWPGPWRPRCRGTRSSYPGINILIIRHYFTGKCRKLFLFVGVAKVGLLIFTILWIQYLDIKSLSKWYQTQNKNLCQHLHFWKICVNINDLFLSYCVWVDWTWYDISRATVVWDLSLSSHKYVDLGEFYSLNSISMKTTFKQVLSINVLCIYSCR